MVEKKVVEVQVTKEAYELAEGLKQIVMAIQEATTDGWQTTQDLPVIITKAITNLVPAIAGAEKISEEAKEELEAFATGLMIKSKEIGFLFYKKKEQ